jgi:hypothetical protein
VSSEDPQEIVDSGVDRFAMCVPSNSKTGLELVSGFTVPQGGSASFAIDFDPRKAVTQPSGVPFQSPQKYLLRPALTLVDDVEAGHIAGTVDESLLDEASGEFRYAAAFVPAGPYTVAFTRKPTRTTRRESPIRPTIRSCFVCRRTLP